MAPYLPIQAVNRSQRVRIGGKNILPGVNSYIDLGQLDVATGVAVSAAENGETGPGLTKETVYSYAVIANDNFGGSTLPSLAVEKETGKGKNEEGKKNYNENTVTWSRVNGATSYTVIRAAGKLSEIKSTTKWYTVKSGITGTSVVDTGATLTETTLPVATNAYVQNRFNGYPTKKEIQNHLAIGAIIITGPLTQAPSDWVQPFSTSSTTNLEVTAVASKKVKVKTGKLYNAVTGVTVELAAEATLTPTESEKTNGYVYSYVVFNTLTQLTEVVAGTEVVGPSKEVNNASYPTLTNYQRPLALYL